MIQLDIIEMSKLEEKSGNVYFLIPSRVKEIIQKHIRMVFR